jgi:hypothetical protein
MAVQIKNKGEIVLDLGCHALIFNGDRDYNHLCYALASCYLNVAIRSYLVRVRVMVRVMVSVSVMVRVGVRFRVRVRVSTR